MLADWASRAGRNPAYGTSVEASHAPIPHAAAAKAAFAEVLMSPSHRVVWFIDASGKLHLIGATNGISLILDQSVHG